MTLQLGKSGLIALCGLGIGGSFQQAIAQEAEVIELGTIIIYGRSGLTWGETIDEGEIAASEATTLNELFANSPEVVVSGANRPAAQKVYVRGIEETMLNVTVDGAKLGGSMYVHSGNFGIDPDLLKMVEVQPGSSSALMGPGALGGAIRYETKSPEDLLLPGQRHGSMLKFSAQSNGRRFTPALAFYGVPDDRFAYLVYGTKSWADNYKDGNGNPVADTGNEPLDALVKLRFRPAEGHELAFSSTWRRDNGYRAYRSNFGIPSWIPDANPENQELGWRSTSLKYSWNPADNPLIDLSITGWDTYSRLHRDITASQTGEFFTRGLDIRNSSDLGPLLLTYGYDYNWVRSVGRTATSADASETGRNHGLYLQADYRPDERWLISAGLRYDKSTLGALNGTKYEGDHLSPNIGLRFEPTEGMALFASWGEAFRGVQPADGFTLPWPLGIGPANDPTLNGEVSETAEIGFSFDRGGWRGGISAFSSRVDDKIRYWQGRSNPWWRANDGVIKSRGITANLGRSWDNWSADLQLSHTDVKYNDEPVSPGDWLDGVTPGGDRIVLKLGYDVPERGLKIGWTSTVVLKQKDLPAGFALSELPGYDTHDLSITWQPAENQVYNLALTNIFNKQYLDHSTAYYGVDGWSNLYEMGRSLRLSATIRF